jgi:hypothetical protein
VSADDSQINQQRRMAWCAISAFHRAWFIAFLRFSCRGLCRTSHDIQIGYPSDYSLGVDTKFQQKYRIGG